MRLPFFYGWVVVAVVFVTMGIGVNARTAFSLLFPPILDEFGWDRGVTAGAFSFGFLVSAVHEPDARPADGPASGPRVVMELGVGLMAAGLLLAPLTREPWHLYATLGVLVGGGSVCLGYSGQSLFLPNWFVRRRGLAISIAFAGVGVGSIVLLPLAADRHRERRLAHGLLGDGRFWCWSCWRRSTCCCASRPQDMGLQPDGDRARRARRRPRPPSNVVDPAWAAVDWTLGRAMRTARFWWIALGYFCGLFAWYAVQVHQTKYLIEIGFSPTVAAWALGLVSLARHPRPDRARPPLRPHRPRMGVDRRHASGSRSATLALLAAAGRSRAPALLYVMVAAQGVLGYGLTSVFGAIPAEIFQGRHYGTIFGTLMLAAIGGGALGPWADRRAARRLRQLRARLLDRRRAEPGVGGRDLARRPAQGARRRRPDAPARGGAERVILKLVVSAGRGTNPGLGR